MSQITLTLDLTPENVSVLCEVLPRLTIIGASTGDEAIESVKPSALVEKKDKSTKLTAKDKQENTPITDGSEANTPPADAPPESSSSSEAPNKTDVRALALKLSKAGKQDAIKEIFAKYGADKLSGVAEKDYPELMKDLVAAND